MKYNITATASATTANELASKLMVAAYTQEIDLEDLKIEQVGLTEPSLGDEPEVFQFPHVQKLMKDLNDRNHEV